MVMTWLFRKNKFYKISMIRAQDEQLYIQVILSSEKKKSKILFSSASNAYDVNKY